MKYKKFSFLSCLFIMLMFSFQSYAAAPKIAIKFGINSTDSPKVIAQKILPILRAVESDLEERLKHPVTISFMVFRTYTESIKGFVDGVIDFGRLGPASYIIAKQQNPGIRLLAMENRKGKNRFNGLIVVKQESPLQTLSDLKGQKFAFGNKVSTIGRYLSQLELTNAGICAKDLAEFAYLRRHDNVFTAVATGRYDAGALKESTFYKRNSNYSIMAGNP